MWLSPECGAWGVCLVSSTRLNHSPVPPPWQDVVYGYREMGQQEVGRQTDHIWSIAEDSDSIMFRSWLSKSFTAGG